MFAFVFPGQGSQRPGMGKALAERYAVARRVFEEADEALGYSLSKLCWEGSEQALELTENSQPAVLTTSIAALRVLQAETGLNPVSVAGHSLGEYSALVCAEALAFGDAVRVVHLRGKFMQEAVLQGQGGMVAIMGTGASTVAELCAEAAQGEVLAPANYNGPGQTVVAGTSAALERLTELAKSRSLMVRPLRVSAPFHCALMQPARDRLALELEQLSLAAPKVPVLSNVTAEPHTAPPAIVELLTEQVTAPVLWEASVRNLAAARVRHVVEVGAGASLNSMIRRIDGTLLLDSVEKPEDVEALAKRAEGDLAAFVGPLGQWLVANDGSLYDRAASKVVWADTQKFERVDDRFWRSNPNGTRLRKFGGLRIIWPDGRLEVHDASVWLARRDGSFIKQDWSLLIHRDGRCETLDAAEWQVGDGGTLKKKDGTRILWADGLEWDFHDQFAHGL